MKSCSRIILQLGAKKHVLWGNSRADLWSRKSTGIQADARSKCVKGWPQDMLKASRSQRWAKYVENVTCLAKDERSHYHVKNNLYFKKRLMESLGMKVKPQEPHKLWVCRGVLLIRSLSYCLQGSLSSQRQITLLHKVRGTEHTLTACTFDLSREF